MTPPSQHDPRPPYQQAADALRREIQTGRLKPGEQLPSHRELQERFNIANMTARSALRVLREEGLIYTVQGRGSYVADKPAGHRPEVGEKKEAPERAEADSAAGHATEPVTIEDLRTLQEQLYNLNALVQDLRKEFAELKAEHKQR
ncbi:GntR family transcriptional regulator [Streptomyces endophytica]|uniref:GntR family transcriptional regulator n=1 Tax=Streptomyces endophytica TaxID=2991496 RepID=A0ABY6P9X1_9ACTN|nr:GntR family transcriptional regulator [Streptomyces endophytica]UZJ30624.1 GntR family transcriptional regulator [Streptomyces endophytica]